MDFKGSWEDHLHLIESLYNNNYRASIQMELFEALYGRKCRSPVCWDDIGERKLLGPELITQTMNKVSDQKAFTGCTKSPAELGRFQKESPRVCDWRSCVP